MSISGMCIWDLCNDIELSSRVVSCVRELRRRLDNSGTAAPSNKTANDIIFFIDICQPLTRSLSFTARFTIRKRHSSSITKTIFSDVSAHHTSHSHPSDMFLQIVVTFHSLSLSLSMCSFVRLLQSQLKYAENLDENSPTTTLKWVVEYARGVGRREFVAIERDTSV